MKKLILATLVLGTAQVVSAADGTVNFTGKIVDTTCAVDSNSQTLNVTLPTVSKTALDKADKTAGLTLFSIQLNNCNQNVRAYFEPTPGKVDYTSGRVINTNSTTGDSVEIELLDSDGTTPLQISENDGDQGAKFQNISTTNNKLRYFARYHAKKTAVAGSVTGSVDYTVVYE